MYTHTPHPLPHPTPHTPHPTPHTLHSAPYIGGVAGADGGAATHAETAVDSITFISGAVLGDTCTIVSNGVNYFVTGYAADVAHITVA